MQKSSVNKVIIVGNLGWILKQFPNKDSGYKLKYCNQRTGNQEGQIQDRTELHRAVLYGKMVETASQYMKKGSKEGGKGDYRTKSEDQNQNKRKLQK